MEIRPRGTRYRYNYLYEHILHAPYDYKTHGLLNKLLPKVITSTQNETTQAMLKAVEYILVWLMKYVDKLRHFKDWNYYPS